jgi:hypothetical protein
MLRTDVPLIKQYDDDEWRREVDSYQRYSAYMLAEKKELLRQLAAFRSNLRGLSARDIVMLDGMREWITGHTRMAIQSYYRDIIVPLGDKIEEEDGIL